MNVDEFDANDKSFYVTYSVDSEGLPIKVSASRNLSTLPLSITRRISQICRDTFLPTGYPLTVRPEYLEYQLWDAIQGLCSYLRSVITTKAVLAGVGVGNSAVTPLAAALAWVMKDGMGMIGSLSLAYYCTSSFEAYTKEWRLSADVLNNIGLIFDLLCSVFPDQAQYLLIISSISKSCCGLIAGATKARISAHFAKKGHLADVNAKESTQETAVALIGLVLGMGLARIVGNNDMSIWSWFVLFLIVHMYSNYRLIKVLIFENLNPQRTYLITKFAKEYPTAASALISSPVRLRNEENLFLPFYLWFYGPKLGASIGELYFPTPQKKLEKDKNDIGVIINWDVLRKEWKNQSFCIGINRSGRIIICLEESISDEAIVKAYFIGCYLHFCLSQVTLNEKWNRLLQFRKQGLEWYDQLNAALVSSPWEISSASSLIDYQRRFRIRTEEKKRS